MNEGDYIRYKIQNKYEDIVRIGKIVFIGVEEIQQYNREPRGELYCQVDNELRNLYAEDIIKSSPNIIDLIEEGDYVNGFYVINKPFNQRIHTEFDDFIEEDIESIVTKEQFEKNEYKI